ncbi:DUF5914 domain-containing protein [Allokutzneria sp. NRRL B-24872]|uniref:DUF5914 domain-containing protein n=1 Tax=Allokutzneria sp. NRRL B-24872 TaxID=1137961 RepID=UPI000A3A0122|nr:DUF5914 domain-containing protein [Allokutzneria sp. NRRL B-24872]
MSWPKNWPIRPISPPPWARQEPTWRGAKPSLISAALNMALAKPSGNWFVLAASSEITSAKPFGRHVAGQELVAWRAPDGELRVGPGACPHLGAPLCDAAVDGGALVCRWHGLSLGDKPTPGWKRYPAHDDGVLAWVRLDRVGGEEPLEAPVLPERPPHAEAISAVATVLGRCEPEDVVFNRLDPWHGAWFHPYSFAELRVLDAGEEEFLVEVTFRLARNIGVPVLARFSCPEPRTVVMHIVEGEGVGSVVETHATPIAPGRTAVIEATIAHSARPGFAYARHVAGAVRPAMRWAAKRLWRDDIAYAERRFALREEGRWPG